MKQYKVTGMSCASCSARVEKAVNKVEGVTSCSVNLLTNSMGVEGTASDADIIKAVKAAGYGAEVKGAERSAAEKETEDKETPALIRRVVISVIFLIVLMYFSMGHMMWGWLLPKVFDGNHVAMGLVQLLLTGAVMIINGKFFISGFKSLVHRSPNMDTLVAMGASAAFVYSLYALFAMTDAQVHGGAEAAMAWMDEFYFESAAMILTLITVGKMLEARSKGRTTNALKSLIKLSPKTASIIRNGEETVVAVEQVKKGDIFAVRPGGSIPVDGIVIEGSSAVNEAALTGESIPVDKAVGDSVSAATINLSGYIKCEATRVGEDTTLSQIIKMVSDAAATKAPIAKAADRVSGIFVPAVIAVAVISTVVWLIAGETVGFALARGISVLVISCPCALGLATPVAIMVGSGVGARQGILFKNAVSLENAGRAQIVALDKTGTITKGEPKVTDIIPVGDVSGMELLKLAYSLEEKSEHPLARAVIERGNEEKLSPYAVENFMIESGNGLSGIINGRLIVGGSLKFISSQTAVSTEIRKEAERLADEGKTPLLFTYGGTIAGIIAVADIIKEESPQAVRELRNMGIRVVMLTGDNARTARAVGDLAGVDEVIAGVLPDGKERVIRELKKQGRTIMVGDGINDAPALTSADTGIAIGAGVDVAIDAADVVLMKSRLSDVPAAIRLSRATLRNIHENLFWAFIYNIIGIPLAAGVWIPIFGWTLNPMFGAAAMSLSSFCVVTNALRLNLKNICDSGHDKVLKNRVKILNIKTQEEKTMEKTFKVEGMMCGHCEAAVKKAVEAIDTVAEAVASHTAGTVTVKLTADTPDDVIIKAIEDKDYKVVG
ncbi:MAG: heavy metal translocating P-type ATPase [Clostridiales bacterium]|nr:heavy metal translocating P-type ATPase [Clostridiales bacterium]